MNRLVFKKWVVWLLIIINTFAICIMGSECEDLTLFIIGHLIAGIVFVINSQLLLKYGKELR